MDGVGIARAIAVGWGGDANRDSREARAQRKNVLACASPSLRARLEKHDLVRVPRIVTATRLARVARDLASDPSVDADALYDAFIARGSTGFALGLEIPARAVATLRTRVREKELDLQQLDLETLPDAIADLDIERIDARYNRIRSISPALARVPLRRIYLAYNQMREVPAELFELRTLTALSLDDNALETIPDDIGNLSELRDLWLSDNPLHALPRGLLRLTKLEFLHLGNLPWTEPPAWLAEMKSLEELWLASPTLERLPPEICSLPKLRRLHLWYSKLASLPEELFACTKLEELRVRDNPLPEEVLARLAKALPRTTIY